MARYAIRLAQACWCSTVTPLHNPLARLNLRNNNMYTLMLGPFGTKGTTVCSTIAYGYGLRLLVLLQPWCKKPPFGGMPIPCRSHSLRVVYSVARSSHCQRENSLKYFFNQGHAQDTSLLVWVSRVQHPVIQETCRSIQPSSLPTQEAGFRPMKTSVRTVLDCREALRIARPCRESTNTCIPPKTN